MCFVDVVVFKYLVLKLFVQLSRPNSWLSELLVTKDLRAFSIKYLSASYIHSLGCCPCGMRSDISQSPGERELEAKSIW